MTEANTPLYSLREGRWFKLICGASFQHLPAIRSLVLVYAWAGADCVDVAADPAVIAAARSALQAAAQLKAALPAALPASASPAPTPVDAATAATSGTILESQGLPWLMVSLNDGEDPHFRKAFFDPHHCPSDCDRPCERICPTHAIYAPLVPTSEPAAGVSEALCYGCGRCVPVCPYDRITTASRQATPDRLIPGLIAAGIDAIEIHTQIGREVAFRQLWAAIAPHLSHLKLIAVSCHDDHLDPANYVNYLRSLTAILTPDLAQHPACALVWQTDGRPMSGDLGAGATRAAIALGQRVAAAGLPGFVQLAGGTNDRTVPKLRSMGLIPSIAGVAYGGAARSRLQPLLDQLALREAIAGRVLPIESQPDLWTAAVVTARSLIAPLKDSGAEFLNSAPGTASGDLSPLSTTAPRPP